MSSFHLHDIQRKTGKFIRKFGTHENVSNGISSEAIWSYADVAGDYSFPSDSGELMWISSSNNLDNQVIQIEGLDEFFLEKSEEIVLQGQTPLILSGKWSRVNRVFNKGSSDLSGNVFVYTGGDQVEGVPTTSSSVKAIIENGHNQTMQSIYSVPANCQLNLSSYHISCDAKTSNSAANLTVSMMVREFGSVFRTQEVIAVSSLNPSIIKLDMPLPIPGKSDILFKINSSTDNNMHVHCVFEGMLL